MATIVIKDLQESTELDRQAMRAIAGGARLRAAGAGALRQAPSRTRLFEFARTGNARGTAAPPQR